MFNPNKKNLIFFSSLAVIVITISVSIPNTRQSVINVLKSPFVLLSIVGREVKGIVFYHRNFVENALLKKEVDLLRNRLNSLNELSLENARLKQLLMFKKSSIHKLIAARVIARSPDNWSSIIIIDKGRQSNVSKGCIVISHLGLLGRVIESAGATSKIMLINDPNFSVSAIDQRSRQEGLVCGTLGSSLLMKYLPKDADIQIADQVVTSGLTEIYPKGLLIGTVMAIADEFSGLGRYALIKPAVNLTGIEEVLVIVK